MSIQNRFPTVFFVRNFVSPEAVPAQDAVPARDRETHLFAHVSLGSWDPLKFRKFDFVYSHLSSMYIVYVYVY